MKKLSIILLTIILITFAVLGFKFYGKTKDKDNNDILIGLSLDSLVIERWELDRDLFVSRAKELGADVIVQNANKDTDEQISQIKYLIDKNVDVLVIVPHDGEALTNVVESARKKGIKVISYDRLIKNSNVDLYISFDNEKVGEIMANSLVEKKPKGKYIIINGAKEDYNTHMVNEGIYNILNSYIENGDIKILNEVWAEGWREEDAYNVIDEALKQGNEIDGIIGGDDRLAEAAIQALSERRLAGEVFVVGQDAELAACQRIVEGFQLMTIYKPIKVLAQEAADIAVNMAKGEKFLANSEIYDGKYYIPFQIEEPIPVYKDNMLDVIVDDNFHRIDQIYMNVPKAEWPEENKD
ncbi:MAG: substrate-binding domain-containing protein [Clostridiaceae bacterium]